MINFSDDNVLMEGFKNREASAEDFIFRKYFRALCFFADNLINDLHASEDIVSESFVKLYDRRNQFEKPENIKAFLYVVVRNSCLNYNEAKKKKQTAFRLLELLTLRQEEFIDPTVQNEIIFAGLVRDVHQEIENLPDKCRTIFKMIFFSANGNRRNFRTVKD